MFGWIIRAVMAVAGVIASWFVARDASNFGLFQMVVSIPADNRSYRDGGILTTYGGLDEEVAYVG